MRRREFITLLRGGVSLAWPLAARAQQLTTWVIGILDPKSSDMQSDRLRGLRQALKEAGFAEGENLAIQYRWAEGQYDRLPVLAADLVRHRVAVIVTAGGTPTAIAAKSATETIPIVFLLGSNPVQHGLVESLARPGGNVTGVTVFDVELVAKGVDYFMSWCPRRQHLACLSTRTIFLARLKRETHILPHATSSYTC